MSHADTSLQLQFNISYSFQIPVVVDDDTAIKVEKRNQI